MYAGGWQTPANLVPQSGEDRRRPWLVFGGELASVTSDQIQVRLFYVCFASGFQDQTRMKQS